MAVKNEIESENGNGNKKTLNFSDDILSNEIRFRILQLLFVYGELSLTALSKHMHKSKPALHHHLQIMIDDFGVIKVSR
ncbi:MAG: winged helix-turn-helix domain-containing protein, partial [Candidatus Odinarchaeota archaeon]